MSGSLAHLKTQGGFVALANIALLAVLAIKQSCLQMPPLMGVYQWALRREPASRVSKVSTNTLNPAGSQGSSESTGVTCWWFEIWLICHCCIPDFLQALNDLKQQPKGKHITGGQSWGDKTVNKHSKLHLEESFVITGRSRNCGIEIKMLMHLPNYSTCELQLLSSLKGFDVRYSDDGMNSISFFYSY